MTKINECTISDPLLAPYCSNDFKISFNSLPNELIVMIGTSLDDQDKYNFELASKRFHEVFLGSVDSLYYTFGNEEFVMDNTNQAKLLISNLKRAKKIKSAYVTISMFSECHISSKKCPSLKKPSLLRTFLRDRDIIFKNQKFIAIRDATLNPKKPFQLERISFDGVKPY